MSAQDEAERRQQEINAFAAMAAGDFSSISFEASSSSTTSKPSQDAERGLFAQAASEPEDSGTFQFTKSDKKDSNLEAAAAALADPPSSSASPIVMKNGLKSRIPLEGSAVGAPSRKMKPRKPMHTQRVFFSKPLFFGHVPPRIVKEARQIVSDALQEQGQDLSDPSSINISTLSPGVRNLIGVFRAYGNGVSILPGAEEKDEKNQPTSYVSVFCPKWSEVMDETTTPPINLSIQREETTVVTETTIAETVAAESSTQEAPIASGSLSGPASSTDNEESMSERDWFSMMARGEDDGGSFGNASAGTSDSVQHDSNSSRQNNSDSNNNDNSNMVPSPDVFSQWVLGESSSSPTSSPNFGNSMVYTENGNKEKKRRTI